MGRVPGSQVGVGDPLILQAPLDAALLASGRQPHPSSDVVHEAPMQRH